MKVYKPSEITGVNPFYLNRFKYKKEFEHVGYLEVNDQEEYSYFSCKSDQGQKVPILGFYGYPVFSFENYFMFDSEYRKKLLYSNIKDKPYILFFVGGDDHSTGLRFKDKQEAINFLNRKDITFFDDIYEFLEIQN